MEATLTGQAEKEYRATPVHVLGTVWDTPDGRRFRYVRMGANGVTAPGYLFQGAVPHPSLNNPAGFAIASAVPIGSTMLPIQLPATVTPALEANEYADGKVYVDIGVGDLAAQQFTIDGHSAAAQNTILNLRLSGNDPVPVAIPAGRFVSLAHNPYRNVQLALSPLPTSQIIGVSIGQLAASAYGWMQTRGIAPVLLGGTVVAGTLIYPTGGAPAAGWMVAIGTAATGSQPVGTALHAINGFRAGFAVLTIE